MPPFCIIDNINKQWFLLFHNVYLYVLSHEWVENNYYSEYYTENPIINVKISPVKITTDIFMKEAPNIIKKLFKLKNNNYDHWWIRYGYWAPSTTWFSVDHKSLKIAQIKKIKTLCVSKSTIFFWNIYSKIKN